jgi:2-polyprenyl-3-methyl-5-hydroxy-6-metoxy-1,4-benzoquinol methylase
MSEIVYFDKYDAGGAYHWAECDRRYANWRRYNPALDARYELTMRAVRGLGLSGSLLDVGCGDGVLMARLAPLFDRVVGVDADAGAVGLAAGKLRDRANCEARQAASDDLPFADRVFEVVTSADVIEHLKEPRRHLSEIARVLKRHGALVMTTPQWRADGKWDARHEKEYRAAELAALLADHFTRVELSYFWPAAWSRIYATRAGWRLVKLMAIQIYNPFLGEGTSEPEGYGQLLAVCREPSARDRR